MSHSILQINIDTQNMPVNLREQRSFATTYWYSKYTYILTKERSPAREKTSQQASTPYFPSMQYMIKLNTTHFLLLSSPFSPSTSMHKVDFIIHTCKTFYHYQEACPSLSNIRYKI